MDVGDLLAGDGGFWVVRRVEPPQRKAVVEDQDAFCQWRDFEALAKLTRLCNPARDWPTVRLPSVRHGRLLTVLRADLADPQILTRFMDWFRLDEFQMGGVLYLNPALNLGFRDRLTVTYADGFSGSVNIPKGYKSVRPTPTIPLPGSVRQKPPPVIPLLDRLLQEGEDE